MATNQPIGGTEPSLTRESERQKLEESKLGESATRGSGPASAAGMRAGEKANRNVIDIIKMEHQEVMQLYKEYQSATSGEIKEAKGYMILKKIVEHSGKEEITLYPILRKKLDNGDAIIDESEKDHQKVTEDLYALDQLTWAQSSGEFDRLVKKTMEDLCKHINDEENVVLPQLASKCTELELMDLGKSFLATTVTTRPHPSAPREGTAAAAAHMASVPVDKARDLARFNSGAAAEEMAKEKK